MLKTRAEYYKEIENLLSPLQAKHASQYAQAKLLDQIVNHVINKYIPIRNYVDNKKI